MSTVPVVTLTVGAGHIDRVLADAGSLLVQYRQDTGADYLDYQPVTSRDHLYPEDVAVTLLVNSRAQWNAVRSLRCYGATIDLSSLPDKPLGATTPGERQTLAQLIAHMAHWPGFGASMATKVLHKKRPALIPILDNQAIFGAYMAQSWPARLAATDTIKDENRIGRALDWIAIDLTRAENSLAWGKLLALEPSRTRIQLFDSIWWMYFRNQQPIVKGGTVNIHATDDNS